MRLATKKGSTQRTLSQPMPNDHSTAVPSQINLEAEHANETNELDKRFITIFRYRHLLSNLRTEYAKRDKEEARLAPRVRGPRAAAVLARLWANEDLGLKATSQKAVGLDLAIGQGDLGKSLKILRKSSPTEEGCVKLLSSWYEREKLYQITEEGKRELENWLLLHYAPQAFIEFIKEVGPDLKRIDNLIDSSVEILKRKAKEMLSK